ncbi:MAG: hypothetical protein K2I30_00505, partial [Clostridia bacterium]|nr:hypothetical protein [Clostridia bacterium]
HAYGEKHISQKKDKPTACLFGWGEVIRKERSDGIAIVSYAQSRHTREDGEHLHNEKRQACACLFLAGAK